ncbi:MAG: ATP-dependent 6-phosphofructokinase [Deltaproteobacteria bacterium]|nr:ATP-dependent 6-phosphofructokinase [Deltaproteobacteria bacterium]MBW2676639.1 ATP-dependent 6-phosphofructokinase [Deltaproteobacteria bacterium]
MIQNIEETRVQNLGKTKIPSPIQRGENFVSDEEGVMVDASLKNMQEVLEQGVLSPYLELAGPREKIYFDPSKLRCAIVTCGGLCPGLNDIIRSVVLELFFGYGVRNIYGIRYGLQGFIPKYNHDIMELNPEAVANILELGGSILGSSRGPQDIEAIADSLERMNIGILFMVGGDGTLKAATLLADTILERGLKISVVGIPKTIDNDIYMVARSFGFETAVDVATEAIKGAHNESKGYPNGIGLIKLMGRHSGYIAATATLAQQDVNFVLIPEVDFDLEGPQGLFAAIENRLAQRFHAVIVVAEGAGQKYFDDDAEELDESGNIRLKDIGIFFKNRIIAHFNEKNISVSLKYIDPSYMIRSLPANANDHVFCSFLGRDAVHAGMAGKTNVLVGYWNYTYVHIPMALSVGQRKQVDPGGKLWHSVLEATGQGVLKNDSL